MGMDTDTMGRTQAMDLAVVGDVKAALRDLIDAVKATATADRITKIRDERLPMLKSAVAQRHKTIMDAVAANILAPERTRKV